MSNENKYEKFIHRQGRTIEQMGFTINILIVLGVGILGFLSNLIIDDNFNPDCRGKVFFLFSILLTGISILLGLFVSWNRLIDFRKTTKTTNPNTSEKEKDILRIETKKLGEKTREILKWQLMTFITGISAATISLLITYHTKLF